MLCTVCKNNITTLAEAFPKGSTALFMLILLLTLLPLDIEAQTPVRVTLSGCSSSSGNDIYVYESVDIPPTFPGGDAAMLRYINRERQYPRQAYENAVEGRVLCSFVVETDGSLSNIEVVRGVEESLNREALRIVSSMPYWSPGKVGNSIVRVYCIIPIPFRR